MEDWQKQLEGFKKDPEAAKKELLRAKSVYEAEQAKGAGNDRLTQISTWANQVRGAAGISNDDADFGVNSTAQRVKELMQGTTKPTTITSSTGLPLKVPDSNVRRKTTTAAAPTVTTPSPAPTTPTATTPSFEAKGTNLVNTMFDPTEVLQRIKKQRDIQQQGLNNQERVANENAYNSLNQNDVAYHTDLNRLKELIAVSTGNGESGNSVTAMVGANTQRQQGINQVEAEKNRLLQNVAEQRTVIENNASADEAAALAGNNSQRAAQLLQLMKDSDAIGFRDKQFGWQQDQADRQYGLNVSDRTGYLGNERTLAGQQQDLGAQDQTFRHQMANKTFDREGVWRGQDLEQRDWDNSYKQSRAGEDDRRWQLGYDRNVFESDRGYNYQAGRDQVGDQRYNNEFEYKKIRDSIGDEQYKQKFDEDVRRFGITFAADQAYRSGQLGLQSQSNNLAAQRFAWEKDPSNPDNVYKNAQIAAAVQSKPINIGDNIDTLNKMYTSKDPMSGDLVVKDTYGLRQAIIGMGYNDDDTIKLLNYYRLPIQPTTYGGGR